MGAVVLPAPIEVRGPGHDQHPDTLQVPQDGAYCHDAAHQFKDSSSVSMAAAKSPLVAK